jgi:hypothetical protein
MFLLLDIVTPPSITRLKVMLMNKFFKIILIFGDNGQSFDISQHGFFF